MNVNNIYEKDKTQFKTLKIYRYAQTNIQLFNQLLEKGCPKTELVCIHNAYEVAMGLFTGRFQSSGKDFIAHGVGTASILSSLGLPSEVVAAGLIHNVYMNGDFGYREIGISDAKRKYIKDALGKEVEEYVYRFNVLRWNSRTIRAICDDLELLGPIERNTILIRLADALEHNLALGVLYYQNVERERWLEFINQNGHIMVEIAEMLGFPTLAADLEKVFKDTFLAEIPVEFRNESGRSHSFVIPPKSYSKRQFIALYQRLEHKLHSLRRQVVPKLSRLRRQLGRLLVVIDLRR